MPRPRYWTGAPPEQCELIGYLPPAARHDDITKKGEFVDGKTTMGPWANMCPRCAKRYGAGLGTGLGQRFTRQADGRWLKTAG